MSRRRKEVAQIDNLIERLRPVFEKAEIREQDLILLMRKKQLELKVILHFGAYLRGTPYGTPLSG
jgi:hypothetical protein